VSAADAPPAPARDLLERLLARIGSDGPISVAAYMADALYDARAGYYRVKDPIGAGADYVTAPELSQMFGELVGLWAVQSWFEMGAPAVFDLIELGPGRGTMLADALRAARRKPEFLAAAKVTLVEASPALQAVQARALEAAPCPVLWTERLPAGDRPAIVLANEFLDCLPIRQFVAHEGVWRERLVGLDPSTRDGLVFQLSPAPLAARDLALIPPSLRDAPENAPENALVEARPGVESLLDALAARFGTAPGRALFIDYGPAESEVGDTLQALKSHEKVDALAFPGEADLTARVDFAELARLARAAGLEVAGPLGQGAWLKALGLEHRALALREARPDQKPTIARQLHRLTDETEMGALFKALAVSAPGLPPAAGF
jgi:NADH dehydrogenase [ubiquinone] 1 alpha subcomplex assembly factor 7